MLKDHHATRTVLYETIEIEVEPSDPIFKMGIASEFIKEFIYENSF